MSEINMIKTISQPGLDTHRNVNTQTNTASNKTQAIVDNSSRTDMVSLTDTATQLQSLQQTLVDAPRIDNDRVSALKAAIAEGSYHIDPAELASKIINFEQQLG